MASLPIARARWLSEEMTAAFSLSSISLAFGDQVIELFFLLLRQAGVEFLLIPAEINQRPCLIALDEIGQAQVVEGEGMVRFDLHRFLPIGDRPVQVARLAQGHTETVVSGWIVRVELDRALEVGNGLVVRGPLLGLEKDRKMKRTQVVEDNRVVVVKSP